jgi:signal transduction histidine kinase/CheY-like chemotaxis protein
LNIYRLIFSDNAAQALRIKRQLGANKAYAFVTLLVIFSIWQGLLVGYPSWAIWALPLAANLIFYPAIRSHFNLRFKDPSLTVPQTAYAIFAYMFLIYFSDDARGAFLMLSLSVPIGIALRVRPKQLFWISLLPLLLLASIITVQHTVLFVERSLAQDIIEWMALAGGVAWLSADGVYMARKRREAQESTHRLVLALAENMALVENLTREKKIAEAANLSSLAKSRLVAAANHDLRQPLHALNLFVGQLSTSTNSQQRMEIIRKIEDATRNVNDLFESLMDISKLDADVVDPKIEAIAIDDIFNRMENTFRETAQRKGLDIRFVQTRLGVRSEFILLERILLNLIGNALRYTKNGKVLVGCRRKSDKVHIQIFDTGIGIESEHQQNIFNEFFRIKNDGVMESQGLGLGLAIVQHLCALLNHSILVRSQVNRGSCFTIIVDVAKNPSMRKAEIVHAFTPTHAKLILVVDDEPLVLDATQGILRSWGFDVITAESAEAALNLLQRNNPQPDLIISDYSLTTNCNGIETIRQIRAHCAREIPAFLMSGNTDHEKLSDLHDSGYIILTKPIRPMKLRSLVNKYLPDAAPQPANASAGT